LEDDCQMCGIDRLKCAPIITLKCGHVFHYDCVKQRLTNRWNSNQVNLNFSKCPICFQKISAFFKDWEDSQLLDNINNLRNHLKARVLTQLQQENISLDVAPDHFDFLDEALRKLNFYECWKCKGLYFGGVHECGQVEVSPEQLICGGCSNTCEIHGDQSMIYKCRFCCNLASYFCFGHTHFCESCHAKAWDLLQGNNHEFLKNAAPPCKGIAECPLKMIHPPNGEEFAIGCAICKQSTPSTAPEKPTPQPPAQPSSPQIKPIVVDLNFVPRPVSVKQKQDKRRKKRR
jgi:hypothetical protein